MKHLVQIQNPLHVAMCARVDGESIDQIEAGATVKLDWMPSSGWGLQEAHYTDDHDQVVQIDLDTRSFTMPDYDIVIEGTAKRFSVQDWTTNAPSQSGKVLGIDEKGNIVPTEGGGTPTYEGNNGDVMQSDGNGGIVSNHKVIVTADGDVTAYGSVSSDASVSAKGDVYAGGMVYVGGDVFVGDKDNPNAIHLHSPNGTEYTVTVDNSGNLVVTQV